MTLHGLAFLMFDPMYWLFILPGALLALWAQAKVKNAYAHYSHVPNRRGCSGAEVARLILDRNGVTDVRVSETPGMLSDHYNPLTRELKLSSGVYHGRSVASLGIAAHEVGHALQHAQRYPLLRFRSAWVPLAVTGQQLSTILLLLGLFLVNAGSLWGTPMFLAGIVCFGAVTVFTLITLPVEFNASSRAVALLTEYGVVSGEEETGVRKVLDAAALTYVAAFVSALMQLLYFVMLFMNSRRRD